jgi:hypothetical protein
MTPSRFLTVHALVSAAVIATGRAPVFSDFQSAKLVGPERVEVTPLRLRQEQRARAKRVGLGGGLRCARAPGSARARYVPVTPTSTRWTGGQLATRGSSIAGGESQDREKGGCGPEERAGALAQDGGRHPP